MLFEAEREYAIPLRLAYTGLWCAADREGRFKWEPRRLGVQILPYDGIDFSRVLDALHTRGFIGKYECEGSFFGFIPSFERHQVINNRERDSELPNPYDCNEIDACLTRDSREPHATLTCTSGKEGNMERKGTRNKEQGRESLDDSLPFSSPDFLMFWNNWKQHRIEIKKKLTPTTKKQQLAKLAEMGEPRAIAALKHSLEKGWTGIFEPQGSIMPSAATQHDSVLMAAIDSVRSSWQKIPWNIDELATLAKYQDQLSTITTEDWQVLNAYFGSTQEGYFRPDNRSKFCESFSGIWTACERWKKATGYRAPNSKDSLYYGS